MLRGAAREAGIDARAYAVGVEPLRAANRTRLLVVLLIGVAIAVPPLILGPLVPMAPMLAVHAVLAVVVVVVGRALVAAQLFKAQRRAALALGLCPACGYSIAEIEPEADNCRICPECGSAWRMDEKAG